MREPTFSIDFMPTDKAWIASIQDGSVDSNFIHLYFPSTGDGLTFENFAVNRLSLEGAHGEIIRCTAEFWAGGGSTFPVGVEDYADTFPGGSYDARVTTPYRWLDSSVSIGGNPELQWWNWRYEVNNNLQRLGNVEDGSTREIVPRTRDVSGLIVKDCEDFAEYGSLAEVTVGLEAPRFNITIELDGTEMLNCDRCRWDRLETPASPEDLIAKRFPFTATDLTTLTP